MPAGLNVIVRLEVIDPGEVIAIDVIEPIVRHDSPPAPHEARFTILRH